MIFNNTPLSFWRTTHRLACSPLSNRSRFRTALVAASNATAPDVMPAALCQPRIPRRLCWNDHRHDMGHQ